MLTFGEWFILGLLSATGILLLSSFYHWTEELKCEREYNVYDCEYEWYPVYDEMSPEDEELMP